MPPARDPLRPALELAFEVARIGAMTRPPLVAPSALRPYLRFTRLTPLVLDAVRRVVDDDDGFRARVAAIATEDDVGRAGVLWLARPEGWRDELEALSAPGVAGEGSGTGGGPGTGTGRRRGQDRDHDREARRRLDDQLRTERARAEELRAGLAEQRALREALEASLVELRAERDRLEAERAEAVRRLKAVEADLVEVATERNALRRRVRDLDRAPRPAPGSAVARAGPAGPDPVAALRAELSSTVGRASAALGELDAALDELRALGATPSGRRSDPAPGPGVVADRVRVPLDLPPGLAEDRPEVADHLLRSRGAVLVVDGYNVTKAAWPDLALPDQRARLVQALGELSARTGIDVEVVFDGAAVVPAAPLPAPRGVRVRYSDEAVEADDVVVALVGDLPASRPVLVASSDEAVRRGARAGGANVLHARQLLAVIRR
ncbi:MAG: NYN domain-containing protein [Acidimicrobiia bacterium]